MLSAEARKALSATSRGFRNCFVAQVQVVTVTSREDLDSVLRREWPKLSMVILMNEHTFCTSERLLARIVLSEESSKTSADFFLLRPLQAIASDLFWASSAAQQLAHQMTASWPSPDSVELWDVKETAMSTALMAELSKANLSSLASVSFINCQLNSEGLSLLCQARWHALAYIYIAGSPLDAKGMAVLVTGDWPLLSDISFCRTSAVDAQAIGHLSAAQWPLQNINMVSMPVSAAMTADLAQLRNLTSLTLQDTGLTAAAMLKLTCAEWPGLQRLDLSDNTMGAASMHSLSKAHMPAIQDVKLARAKLTEEGAHSLSQTSWPVLRNLNLSHNEMSSTAVKHIASGVWPQMKDLSVVGNPFGHDGIQHLTKGKWPLLNTLAISLNMLDKHESFSLLGLGTDKKLELIDNPECFHEPELVPVDGPEMMYCYLYGVYSPRCVPLHLWPALHEVMVVGSHRDNLNDV